MPLVNPVTGWNTWNYECLTALSYIADEAVHLEVRISIFDDIQVEHKVDFGWDDLVRLGEHAFDGSYMDVEVDAGFEARFRIEAASEGTTLALRVTPTRTSARRVVLQFLMPGRATRMEGDDGTYRQGDWLFRTSGFEPRHRFYVRTSGPSLVGTRGDGVTLLATFGPEGSAHTVSSLIDDRRSRHLATAIHSSGLLGECAQVAARAAAWNTVCDLSGRGLCTTASRDWSRDWRGVVLFGWDTFLNGLVAGLESGEHAWANHSAALSGTAPEGFVPNWRLSNGLYTSDRSQPPVGAWSVQRTHLQHPDQERLAALYPALLKWNRWWLTARATAEGLLAWGSDPHAGYQFPELKQAMSGTQVCCCYESGMDNSPMFDSVPYNRETGLMEQADVGLTALWTLDCEALASMAAELGHHDEADQLQGDAARMRERMNRLMWDPGEGIYLNRRSDGTLNPRRSPTSFYPLLCGAPDPGMARRLVDNHLLDDASFWGEWPLPSISRSDAAFRDNDYWRGRIWAPMVYFVVHGLLRYGRNGEAADLAGRAVDMFNRNWTAHGSVFENYSSVTGDGGDVPNSDRLYVWGGLIAVAALDVLVSDVGVDVRVGWPRSVDLDVRNMWIRGTRCVVSQYQERPELREDTRDRV